MLIHPAVHIARFGVFPDKELDAAFIESLTGARATLHQIEIARELPALIEDEDNIDDDAVEELGKRQQESRNTEILRMRGAYQFAAKNGWIKPIAGNVCLAPAISVAVGHREELMENLENAVISTYMDLEGGLGAPSLTLPAPPQSTTPVAEISFIRCVLSGEVVPFGSVTHIPHLFRTAAQYPTDVNLDPAMFDLTGIDTVAHCQTHVNLRRSPLMGHGGFKPKPPGAKPA